jgi:hypothetical protein
LTPKATNSASVRRSALTKPWLFEGRRESQLSIERVWAAYTDVNRWAEWTDEIVHASLDGPLRTGVRGRVRYRGAPPVPFTMTLVSAPHRYVTEVRVPLLRLTFDHRLETAGTETIISEVVTFDGLVGPVVGKFRGRNAEDKWPAAIDKMLQLAQIESS